MTLPRILEAQPSTDINEPLLAKDKGWYAKNSDLDQDELIVEYDQSGGFLNLLAKNGMGTNGQLVADSSKATVSMGAQSGEHDHDGQALTADDTSTSLGTYAVTGLSGTAATFNTDDGFKLTGTSSTFTFTLGAAYNGKTVGFALNYGYQTTETDPVITEGFSGVVESNAVAFTFTKEASTDPIILGFELYVLD